jgi:hypothetical protein
MKFILIIVTSMTLRTGTPGVAAAEFDDKQACDAARVALANKFVVNASTPGTVLETLCLPKATQ